MHVMANQYQSGCSGHTTSDDVANVRALDAAGIPKVVSFAAAWRGLQVPSPAKERATHVSAVDCEERCQAYEAPSGKSAALVLNGSGKQKAGGTYVFRCYLRPPSASFQRTGAEDPTVDLQIIGVLCVSIVGTWRS